MKTRQIQVHKKARLFSIIFIGITGLVLITGYLLYNGYVCLNNPDQKQYPVHGIDVSSHQKKINWELVRSQNIRFAYIKATEGKGFVDKQFKANWEGAKKQGIKVGAYHFFTFSSSGIDQAKNFIKTVHREEGNLPPAIDVEFGGNSKSIPDRKTLNKELTTFINEIKNYYRQEPIIYALYNSYDKYILNGFNDNKIWIRDILKFPKLQDKRNWVLWQYCDRGRIKGIDGYVDMNAFSGNVTDFDNMFSKN